MPQMETPLPLHETGSANWDDACLAIDLAACMIASPLHRMPTFCVHAQSGPVLDAWLAQLKSINPQRQMRRLQTNASFADLLGGVDLPATLAAGEPVYDPGFLARCHQGMLVAMLSSPMLPDMAAGLGAVLDNSRMPTNGPTRGSDQELDLGLVIIDQGEPGDDFLPTGLRDRLMFHLDLTGVTLSDIASTSDARSDCPIKPGLCDASLLEELCAVSLSFGLTSLRPSHQALHLACIHAGYHHRAIVDRLDVSAAIRLSLINRAVMVPEVEPPDAMEEQTQTPDNEERDADEQSNSSDDVPQEIDVNSILATLPPELLAAVRNSAQARRGKRMSGRSGGKSVSFKRGRPVTSMRGGLGYGKRLDLIATLRTAAPWQRMRRGRGLNPNRIQVRKRDFHIKRYIKPSESSTIFVVDASGSTAINRLGEAKGAVELLLGESYSRRDHVALISLRDEESQLILPPTRSLARARKTLSGLRGGGGTPLAHGLQKAMLLAQDELQKGRTPNLVLLTDGSANIPLNGAVGRPKAMEDALAISSGLAALGIGILVIDVSRTANRNARKIADEMRANYLPMPFASSKNISDAVRVGQN